MNGPMMIQLMDGSYLNANHLLTIRLASADGADITAERAEVVRGTGERVFVIVEAELARARYACDDIDHALRFRAHMLGELWGVGCRIREEPEPRPRQPAVSGPGKFTRARELQDRMEDALSEAAMADPPARPGPSWRDREPLL